MNSQSTHMKRKRSVLAVLCALAIGPGETFALVRSAPLATPQASAAQDAPSSIPADQLDSLVAPIALYPDPLLAQTLAASTYPLEIMQLQQWLTRNAALKDKALADAVALQPWDASVQALAVLPDVVNRLANDIQWTTDLGNAFLAQQADVMEAVQRMRGKAHDKGNLKSSPQQVVETTVVENERVIVIEPAAPEVVYVPSYDPVVVYGPPVYPYPPIYYPPAGYYAAGMAVSFGVGVAMGAFWGSGGGWGWGPRWGDNDITINNNNNFVRNANVRSGYRGGTVNNTWQHRPEHRGGAPYRDRATANKYGGAARGDSLTQRQTNARQQIERQGGNLPSARAGTSGVDVGNRSSAAGRESGTSRSSSGSRAASADVSRRATGSGSDHIGQRDVSRSSGGDKSAFGGGHQSYTGSTARAESQRGSSSVQSRGGSDSRSGSARSSGGGGRSPRGGGGGGRRR
jgi:hypothetical protein